MIVLLAMMMMFHFGDQCDDCPIDHYDVQYVDRSFNQKALELCTQEAAANATRMPDNEKNIETPSKGPPGTIEALFHGYEHEHSATGYHKRNEITYWRGRF
jgi:hypothetical protein